MFEERPPNFPHLKFGGVSISMQANGCGQYCNPRANLDHLGQYERIEVAIFEDWENGKYLYPSEAGLPKVLDQYWESRYTYEDGHEGSTVGAGVPRELLEEVFESTLDELVPGRMTEEEWNAG